MKSVICAIVKDEQLFIREWVEWNLSHGFDKIYIYEDYGSGSHNAVLSDYINSGKVVLTAISSSGLSIPNKGIGGGNSTQDCLYRWFLSECKTGNIDADWIGFFDVDEFINFEEGYNLIKLEKEYKDVGGILLAWVMYGANGHIERPNGNVVDNYTKHLPLGIICEDNSEWAVKSLVNVKNCDGFKHIHIFNGCVSTESNSVDNSLSFKKAWLNHYFTKSWEDYLDRIFKRGNMRNNNRCLDLFFRCSPEFEDRRKQMIEEQRYRHANGTMWISRREKLISGGNVNDLNRLRLKFQNNKQ